MKHLKQVTLTRMQYVFLRVRALSRLIRSVTGSGVLKGLGNRFARISRTKGRLVLSSAATGREGGSARPAAFELHFPSCALTSATLSRIIRPLILTQLYLIQCRFTHGARAAPHVGIVSKTRFRGLPLRNSRSTDTPDHRK